MSSRNGLSVVFLVATAQCLAMDIQDQIASVLSKLDPVRGVTDLENKVINEHLNLGDPLIAEALIDKAVSLDTGCGHSQLYVLRLILMNMKTDVRTSTLKRLNADNDPLHKSILITIAADYPDNEVVAALVHQLDDKRFGIQPTPLSEGTPRRVCDFAYNQLIRILELKELQFNSSGDEDATRESRIQQFKDFWMKRVQSTNKLK